MTSLTVKRTANRMRFTAESAHGPMSQTQLHEQVVAYKFVGDVVFDTYNKLYNMFV